MQKALVLALLAFSMSPAWAGPILKKVAVCQFKDKSGASFDVFATQGRKNLKVALVEPHLLEEDTADARELGTELLDGSRRYDLLRAAGTLTDSGKKLLVAIVLTTDNSLTPADSKLNRMLINDGGHVQTKELVCLDVRHAKKGS